MTDDETDRTADDDNGSDAVRIDWSDVDRPCLNVIEAVSSVTCRDATDLPLLSETVDADAIDALADSGDGDVVVTFTYAATAVVIAVGGFIEVRPLEE